MEKTCPDFLLRAIFLKARIRFLTTSIYSDQSFCGLSDCTEYQGGFVLPPGFAFAKPNIYNLGFVDHNSFIWPRYTYIPLGHKLSWWATRSPNKLFKTQNGVWTSVKKVHLGEDSKHNFRTSAIIRSFVKGEALALNDHSTLKQICWIFKARLVHAFRRFNASNYEWMSG